ncbi:MAG: methionyl-tRNA formyltransferase [Candidatus Schekmanbacteria bacterium RIFCSPHIGHO2_02_FULL_38_11]|nr:MAG: methionyl-tRNA formyltransferase [Candidatus Schekmanbacteria bacterium RIFCSPHIGHO2_02_FULL_38_11]
MKVIFMGTPEFAIPSLEAIHKKGYEILSVITQPDKPKGRGMHITPSPVKQFALKNDIQTMEPFKIKEGRFIDIISGLNPDIIVVVAYGKILPMELLEIPPMGCINLHASLLPKYRGAAPINWAIINGEKETGVTTQKMALKLDSGDILLQEKTEILETETAGTLHNRLKIIGASLIVSTLSLLERKSINPIPQDESMVTFAPLLKKEDGLIDWNKSAAAILNLMRGTNPWPSSYTFLSGKLFKIWKASLVNRSSDSKTGTITSNRETFLVQTGDNLLSLEEVQLEGHKRMSARDFLIGKSIPPSFDTTGKLY